MSVIPACSMEKWKQKNLKELKGQLAWLKQERRNTFSKQGLNARTDPKGCPLTCTCVLWLLWHFYATHIHRENSTHIQISTYTHTQTHMHEKKEGKRKRKWKEWHFFYQAFWYNCNEGTLRAIVVINRRSKIVSTLCDLGHFYWHSNFPQFTESIRKLEHAFLNMSSALQCQSCWKTAKQQGFMFHCRNSPA